MKRPLSLSLQTVITMINHAIGASGVVSQQCKAVVEQYGQTILDLLLSEVDTFDFILTVPFW